MSEAEVYKWKEVLGFSGKDMPVFDKLNSNNVKDEVEEAIAKIR